VSAAVAMKAEDPAALVPFARMSERDKDAALEALATEIAKLGASSSLIAKLASALRRAADGSFHLELEVPRLSGFPSSKWIGGGHFESWALDLVAGQLPPFFDTAEQFWLATESQVMPLLEAVALVSGPDDPIAELSRRRVEVERRIAERKRIAADRTAERARDEAADSSWMAKNAGRVRRWGELDDLLRAMATAAGDDATLQAFVERVIALAGTRSVQQPRPPAWLWPSG
jgi:hypothetical protein